MLVTISAYTVEIPDWAYHSILAVETGSYYDENGDIVYVNQRRGRHGERGPFQMTYIAWKDIRKPGEKFINIQTDMVYAQECFER